MNQKEKHFVHIVQYQKISMFPHRMDWNFLGGRGSLRPKNLKKCIKFNWNFQRGGGWVLEKIPSMGEVLIFSGTTHCTVAGRRKTH